MRFPLLALALSLLLSPALHGATYPVGDGLALAQPSDVPWESLQPGDIVEIHWRSAPYRDKWVICRAGTADQPITVRGIPGPNGELPVIDGNGAKTRRSLAYWGEARGVIKIGGANRPPDLIPQHLVIENLEITSARPPLTFKSASGELQIYGEHAAALYVEKADHLVIRHCILHDSAHGLFIGSNDTHASSDILVEHCSLYGNGIPKSGLQHNAYTAAAGIIYQYNHFGPLRADCPGNNLKDRSAGLIVRYNWIEGGNRNLDLVDGQDSALIRQDPRYRSTFVYGNILVKPVLASGQQVVHYGGDMKKTDDYRKGTLYFYHNTVVTYRPEKTTLFNLSTNEEACDCRDNLLLAAVGGRALGLLDGPGILHFSHNWLKPDFRPSYGWLSGQIDDDGSNLVTPAPLLRDATHGDYHLMPGSPCLNAAGPLSPAVAAFRPLEEYRPPQNSAPRSDAGKSIGALGPAIP